MSHIKAVSIVRTFALAAVSTVVLSSCATQGLLTERYPAELYVGVDSLEVRSYDTDPQFLAVGDTQAGWRVNEKFLRSENWKTKKGFIFPFYYLYNIGQAMVGTVDFLRHDPDYGGVERRMVRDALYDEVQRRNPDFLLHLGDICLNDGRRPSHWATYLQESNVDVPLLKSVPVVPVIGNHERANDLRYGYPNFHAVFPSSPRFRVYEFPDLALFVVDSNFILDQNQHIAPEEQERLWRQWIVAPAGERPAWLQHELATHHQRFKIVAMHHPPLSFGHHHADWADSDYGDNLLAKRRDLINLLLDNGVQVVMAGHEHIYEHVVVRRVGDNGPAAPRLHIVVTSGGGAPVRSLPDDDEVKEYRDGYLAQGFDADLLKRLSVYHFTAVDVTPAALSIDTYRIDKGIDEHALIDSLVLGGRKE